MKKLSINNFTTKILSKFLSDLYIGVNLKGTKKFGSKVIDVIRVIISVRLWNFKDGGS